MASAFAGPQVLHCREVVRTTHRIYSLELVVGSQCATKGRRILRAVANYVAFHRGGTVVRDWLGGLLRYKSSAAVIRRSPSMLPLHGTWYYHLLCQPASYVATLLQLCWNCVLKRLLETWSSAAVLCCWLQSAQLAVAPTVLGLLLPLPLMATVQWRSALPTYDSQAIGS